MGLSIKLRQVPPRLAAGAFFLNSGIEKLSADEETAAKLHGFASGTYPFLGKLNARNFTKILAITEIAVGAMLVIPVVPGIVAGAGLTAFAGGTVACTPGHLGCASPAARCRPRTASRSPRTAGSS